MKRTKKAAPENHERWVVSYADFVTLLFAFFVLMFASSATDKSKAKAVSQAIQDALNDGVMAQNAAALFSGAAGGAGKADARSAANAKIAGVQDKYPEQMRTVDLQSSLNTLASLLKDEVKKGTVQLKLEARGLVIGLPAAAFFPSGDDAVDPSAGQMLAKIAPVLNKIPNALRLEGHTDSVPINTSRFHSNWELSAARSIAVLRLLTEKYGVDVRRMAIGGYADLNAVESNDTEEGRAKNRRVDIVILNQYGMRAEPDRQPAKTTPPQSIPTPANHTKAAAL